MIRAHFLGDKVFSNSSEAFALNEKSCFGEKRPEKIEYSLVESLFLVQERKMEVFTNKKSLDINFLIKKAKKLDKRIETKLSVFTDLRRKGYLLKSALKFGADFRVYDKGVKPSEDHARWILYTVKDSDPLIWQDFTAKNRIAHSTKKRLLIAIVDEEGDVSYYETNWIKP